MAVADWVALRFSRTGVVLPQGIPSPVGELVAANLARDRPLPPALQRWLVRVS